MYFHTSELSNIKLILFCVLLSFAACKKKKDEEPAPTPAPPTPEVSAMTATVEGNAWKMVNNSYNTYKSSGSYGFSGRTSYDPPNTMISFSFLIP